MRSITSVFIFFAVLSAYAQTGGTYDVTHAVVAGGGGSDSAGGIFVVAGTSGQAAAGANSIGGTYQLRGGFWAFAQLAPTSAGVTVSGRATTADGAGIRNATVSLISPKGERKTALTASFGFFRFDGVAAGQTYLIEIGSKRFTFAKPSRTIFVDAELSGLDFVAEPQ